MGDRGVSERRPDLSAHSLYSVRPMPLADLHTHTNRSDGRLSPPGLIEKAARRGLAAIAVTDHDSVEALPLAAFAAEQHGITLVPGVELSAWAGEQELHLLGYGFDPQNRRLLDHLARYHTERRDRALAMVEQLGALGVPVRWERVEALAGRGVIGRPHVARALVEARHVGSMGEAFLRFIGNDGPAYVARAPVAPAVLIEMLHDAGGICVLAHPGDRVPEPLLAELVAVGLDGVEVMHPSHDVDLQAYWADVARRYGLLATGGSDYHGYREEEEERFGQYGVPVERLSALGLMVDG